MPQYIFINGAPRAGKDTLATYLYSRSDLGVLYFERFSMPHKLAFAQISRTFCDRMGNNFELDYKKEAPISWLGVSYRQWQIDFSEKFMKPLYGEAIFGRMLRRRCSSLNSNDVVIVPDCGFQIEVDCFADQKVLFFQIERLGMDFSNDSRSHVTPHPSWTSVRLYNESTPEALCASALPFVHKWLEK